MTFHLADSRSMHTRNRRPRTENVWVPAFAMPAFVCRFLFAATFTVLQGLGGACVETRDDCNPQNCTGCCDTNGMCQAGSTSDACGRGGGGLDGGADTVVDAGKLDAGTDEGTDASVADAGPSGSVDGGTDRVAQVCARWVEDRADRTEGTWSGSISGCNAGDNAYNRQNALKLVNLYRFIADVPPVTTDASRDALAQECALMMDANEQLSHNPPSSWACYSAGGAQTAASSNISPTPGVAGVDLYMVDPGNPTTIGHRRWILSPGLGPIGLGSTSNYSCMWVLDGSGTATRSFVAWPSPGPFPLAAFSVSPFGTTTVNDTGWTIQSDSIDLAGAQVTVTRAGTELPVTVTQLLGNRGSTFALRFNPQGWLPEAGSSYQVDVAGVNSPISYTVDVVSCP